MTGSNLESPIGYNGHFGTQKIGHFGTQKIGHFGTQKIGHFGTQTEILKHKTVILEHKTVIFDSTSLNIITRLFLRRILH